MVFLKKLNKAYATLAKLQTLLELTRKLQSTLIIHTSFLSNLNIAYFRAFHLKSIGFLAANLAYQLGVANSPAGCDKSRGAKREHVLPIINKEIAGLARRPDQPNICCEVININ